MNRLHTHYDNLNVARNAPPEVIQAAYRALCLKYHPDRNPNNPAAAQIMAVVNAAYAVLSDPVKRAEHDAWIVRREAKMAREEREGRGGSQSGGPQAGGFGWSATQSPGGAGGPAGPQGPGGPGSGSAQARPTPPPRPPRKPSRRLRWVLLLIALAAMWKFYDLGAPDATDQNATQQPPARTATKTAPKRAKTVRKSAAQANATRQAKSAANATTAAQPAAGAQQNATRPALSASKAAPAAKAKSAANRCSVVLDNRRGKALTGQLLRLNKGGKAKVARQFAIPARGTMSVRDLPPGTYEVRYRNPVTGWTGKTDAFSLRETREADGLHSDSLTFTIVGGAKGRPHSTPVGVVEF